MCREYAENELQRRWTAVVILILVQLSLVKFCLYSVFAITFCGEMKLCKMQSWGLGSAASSRSRVRGALWPHKRAAIELHESQLELHISCRELPGQHRPCRQEACVMRVLSNDSVAVLSLGYKDVPLLPGFLFFLCSLTRCLAPAPLKLRPYGATQICLLLLLLLFFSPPAQSRRQKN